MYSIYENVPILVYAVHILYSYTSTGQQYMNKYIFAKNLTGLLLYIYIYIYICVCVCMYLWFGLFGFMAYQPL